MEMELKKKYNCGKNFFLSREIFFTFAQTVTTCHTFETVTTCNGFAQKIQHKNA